jgi:Ser-tRNA(Ala) deacylase AlaX
MTERLYLHSAALNGEASIIEIRPGEPYTLRLNQTLFHPRGGGQPADRGALIIEDALRVEVPVIDVRNGDDGAVDHLVASDAPLALGDRVLMRVDAKSRLLHARLHSAGHLLALAGERAEPQLRGIAGHHWPGESRVEFEGVVTNPEDFERALRSMLTEMCAANLPISASSDGDGRRSIAIDRAAPVPCGGTHVAETAAIGQIEIRKIKIKAGRVRVGYDVEA